MGSYVGFFQKQTLSQGLRCSDFLRTWSHEKVIRGTRGVEQDRKEPSKDGISGEVCTPVVPTRSSEM